MDDAAIIDFAGQDVITDANSAAQEFNSFYVVRSILHTARKMPADLAFSKLRLMTG